MSSQSKSLSDNNDNHNKANSASEEKDNEIISQICSLFQSAVRRKDEYVFLAVNRTLGKHIQSGTQLGTKFIQQNPDIIRNFENFCDIYKSQVTLSSNVREFDKSSTVRKFEKCTNDVNSSNVTSSSVAEHHQSGETWSDTSNEETSRMSRSSVPSPVNCPLLSSFPDISGSTPCSKNVHLNVISLKKEIIQSENIVAQKCTGRRPRKRTIGEENVTKPPLRRSNRKANGISTPKTTQTKAQSISTPKTTQIRAQGMSAPKTTRTKSQGIFPPTTTQTKAQGISPPKTTQTKAQGIPTPKTTQTKAQDISASKTTHNIVRCSKKNNLARQKKAHDLISKRSSVQKSQVNIIKTLSLTYLEKSVTEENRKLIDDKDLDENDEDVDVACGSEPAVDMINLVKGDNCDTQTTPADNKDVLYNCNVCDVQFSKYAEYCQHHKVAHAHKHQLVCQHCGYICTSKRSLLFHNATIHNIITLKTKYHCARCYQSFSVKEIYERHIMKHDFGDKMTVDGKDLVCLICSRKFRKNTAFRKHMDLHKNTNMHENFTCQVCAKVCKTDETFKYHMRLHLPEEEKPFHCQTCNKGFPTKQSYIKHQACHSDTKAFICDLCGKGFKQKKLLDIHIRRHTGERPYKCPECPQTFRCSDNCREHQLSTHRQSKEVCDICGHVCPSKHRLWQHRWRHNQKSWCCEVCGKEFKGRANYLKHYTSLHLSEDKISSFPHKIHKCEYCLKLFNSKNGYRIHLRIHTGEKPHVCHFCGKGFAEKGNLNAHLKIHLDDKKFECTVCGKRFIHNRTLKKHMEASHSKQLNDKESDSTNYDIQHVTTNYTPSKEKTSYLNIADHSAVTEGSVGYASLVTSEGKESITLAETTKKAMGGQGNGYDGQEQGYRADLYPPVSVYGIDGVVWNSNSFIQSEAETSVANISQTMMIL